MLLHGGAQPSAETPQREVVITAAHVETLTHLAIDGEADRAEQFVTAMIASGAPLSQVFLQLLAPAARLLGLLWEEDVYSFAQVTVGLWRLQQILHEQSRHSQGMNAEGRGHRLLLAHQPGSRHTFGVAMLSEFFTRDGWQVDYEPQCQWSDLNAAVSCGWYDVLGVSIGTDDSLVSIASAILTLRTVSRNKRLIVMVGGPAAQSSADLAERCGADCMALDATAAISMANRWMESVARIG